MPSTTMDANSVILTGENPFIRLSASDGSPNTPTRCYVSKPRGAYLGEPL